MYVCRKTLRLYRVAGPARGTLIGWRHSGGDGRRSGCRASTASSTTLSSSCTGTPNSDFVGDIPAFRV